MNENQLPVHHTSAEETGRVLPAVDSGDGGVDIPRERVAQDARDSRLGTWLLASAVISVTTLYTIGNLNWMPSFVAQTVKISKQLSSDIRRRAITTLGGTVVTDTVKAEAGTVAGAAGLKDVDRSAAQHYGTSSGAHQALASDRDETGTRETSRRHTHNGNHTAMSNAGDTGSGGGMLPDLSPQSQPITNNPMDFTNQGFNQGFTFPATEMPKVSEVKISKSKKGYMVPPPPPTPCVLPPGFGFFLTPPGQQNAALQQQLQQAQAQASPKTHNQAAARENTPQQSTAASGRTEATQSAALVAADQELQAALSSSRRTVSEWTR